MWSPSLGPEAIYGTAIIQVIGLIYLNFPVVHTGDKGWGGRVQRWIHHDANEA